MINILKLVHSLAKKLKLDMMHRNKINLEKKLKKKRIINSQISKLTFLSSKLTILSTNPFVFSLLIGGQSKVVMLKTIVS